MITWIRPSGSEIETNDRQETIDGCERMGWKRKAATINIIKAEAKPKTRKKAK